jgi:hypothetical protein
MDLKTAIQILRETSAGKNLHPKRLECQAQKLGLEALERELSVRQYLKSSSIELLPSETKE